MVEILLTLAHRSQPDRLRNRNDTTPACDSVITQHFLENEQCALNKRFLNARSST